MLDRKREIYIKLDKIKGIVETLENIKQLEENLQGKFDRVDRLVVEENKVFENWNSYYEDIIQKLDHVTL